MFALACVLVPPGPVGVPAFARPADARGVGARALALRRRATRRDRARPSERSPCRHGAHRWHGPPGWRSPISPACPRRLRSGPVPQRRARRTRGQGSDRGAASAWASWSRSRSGVCSPLMADPPVRTLRVAIVQGGGRRGLSDLQVPAVGRLRRRAAGEQVGSPAGRSRVVARGRRRARSSRSTGSPEAAQLSEIAREPSHDASRGRHLAGRNDPVPKRDRRLRALGAARRLVREGPPGPLRRVRPVAVVLRPLCEPRGCPPRRHRRTRERNDGDTGRARVAVLVSYEVFFPDRGRSGVRAGGQLIVVPTNTSSYSSEQAPAQEIAASRLQAIEEGRDLLQAAPTGYSAVIDNHGDVLEQTPLSVTAVLRANVALRDGVTLYTRFGDLPTVSLALLAVLAGWVVAVVERRREQAQASSESAPPGKTSRTRPARAGMSGQRSQQPGRRSRLLPAWASPARAHRRHRCPPPRPPEPARRARLHEAGSGRRRGSG